MKLTDIEAAFANAAKAKKIADDIQRLEVMLANAEDGCRFSVVVNGSTIDRPDIQLSSSDKWEGVRIVDAEARCRIVEIIKTEIAARMKEIEAL